MRKTLKYLGITLLLSVIGFLIRDYFFDLSLFQITNNNTHVVSRSISGQFYSQIAFALSIGVIPLLYLIIKKVTKLNFICQGLISCEIIIICGILLWQFRIFQLNNQSQNLSELNTGNGIKIQIDFDHLNLEWYLFFGFIVGTIVSILIFKNRSKKIAK